LSLLLPPCVSCGPQESRLRSPSGCLSSMVELWSLAQTSPSQLWFPLGSGFTWFYLLSDLFPFCSNSPVSCSKCKAVLNLPKLPGVPIPSFKLQAEALVWLTRLRRWWPSNRKVRVTPWVSESRKRYHAPCAWQLTQSKCYRAT
jgi:hypothetical protein